MKTVVNAIEQTVNQHARLLGDLSDEVFSLKRTAGKWSGKEILGHLVDSAQNNIQRLVRAQYEDTPRIVYSQDDWVRLQDYQGYEKGELIRLWVSINRHLCRVLTAMDPVNYEKKCNTGKTTEELHTLDFLARDYHVHMVHHLNQLNERIKN